MSNKQPGQIVKLHWSIKKILALYLVISLLIATSSFVIFGDTAHANAKTPSINSLVTQTTMASSVVATTASTASPTVKPTAITIVTKPTIVLQQSNTQDYWSSIISGLVGLIAALIGGILTYFGSMNAVKRQIDHINAQQINAMRNSLRVEIYENMDLLQDEKRKVFLSTEAWSTYKGNVAVLSDALRNELIKLYGDAKRYNSVREQVSAMYLNKMDNEPLFYLENDLKGKIINISHSVLKKLSEE